MRAKQIITHIKQNTEQAEEITMTKEEVVNILQGLKDEIGILTDRYTGHNKCEPVWNDLFR